MNNVEKIKLQKWWQGEIRELTRKVMMQEEKRQERANKKAVSMFEDLGIERREDIDDLYAYGAITDNKREKLITLWENGQQNDAFYEEKIEFLQSAYREVADIIRDLEAEQ